MQLQPAIAQPPIVADALLAVDDEGGQADTLQLDSRRNAGMAAANDEDIGIAVVAIAGTNATVVGDVAGTIPSRGGAALPDAG